MVQNLVTPIMNMGGRRAVYDLMGMEPPPMRSPPPKLSAPKLIIDRTGQTDQARYSGLKLGQVLDDNTMAEALQRAQEKAQKGEPLRPLLQEETFERPFAGTYYIDDNGSDGLYGKDYGISFFFPSLHQQLSIYSM